VSQLHRERAQTSVFIPSLSFVVEHREPQSSNTIFFLPILPLGIAVYAFKLLWDNLCPNSCIQSQAEHLELLTERL